VLLLSAGLMLGLMPAAAQAAGPGVTLFLTTNPTPIDLPGARFSGGQSISSLIAQNGVDPAGVTFVTVSRGDGGLVTLKRGQLGGAVIIDNGTTTRFVSGGGAGGREEVTATNDSGPLQVNVNGGDISVVASVNRSEVQAGTSVTFSVRVRFGPPGAALSHEWDFGDGTPPERGKTVTHTYEFANNYQARVTVSGANGATGRCETSCAGTDDVEVTVGEPPEQPTTTTPAPGSGTGTSGTPGSSSGTGGGGQGGTGGGSGTGTTPSAEPDPAPAAPEPKPPPPPKKPFGVPISGVLINDPGTTIKKLPSGESAGAAEGPRATRGGEDGNAIEIPISGALAVAFITLGALRERRGVKLRLA